MSAAESKKAIEDSAELPIRGARAKVEVVGTRGIFYKVQQGGQTLKRRRGAWSIALKGSDTVGLRSSGWLPGFQSLWVGEQRVYRFGEDVPLAAKILAFLPLTLILVNPLFGFFVALVLVFYNIVTVKNPVFPKALRIALPIFHTVAGGLLLFLASQTGAAA